MKPYDVSPPPDAPRAPTITPLEAIARRQRWQRLPALCLGLVLAVLGALQLGASGWALHAASRGGLPAESPDLAALAALSDRWLAQDLAAGLLATPCEAPMELCPAPAGAGPALLGPHTRAAHIDRLLHEVARHRHLAALWQAMLGGALLLAAAAGACCWRSRARLIDAGLAAEASARSMSLRDPLTQLLNRRALDFHLPRMLRAADRAGRPVAVMAIALDDVPAVLAEHGPDAVDELLRVCAHRIYARVREIDVVAHLGGAAPISAPGGGRFIVVLEAPESAPAAQAVCERVREALGEPLRLSQGRLPGAPRVSVQVRIGLAVYPVDAPTAERLLQRAVDAMDCAGPTDVARLQEAEAFQRLRSACDSITTGTRPTSTMASEGSAASASLSSRAKL